MAAWKDLASSRHKCPEISQGSALLATDFFNVNRCSQIIKIPLAKKGAILGPVIGDSKSDGKRFSRMV